MTNKSAADEPGGPAPPTTPQRELFALLTCFSGRKLAGRSRRPLEARLRSAGNLVLDATVLRVDDQHKAAVYDPHRVLAGALTSALTWTVFGLLTGGVTSAIISGLLGAVWGGLAAYYLGHHATKAQLTRLGHQLRSDFSALLTFGETDDPNILLAEATSAETTAASVALIADDLSTRVLSDRQIEHQPRPNEQQRLSMILVRYPDSSAAARVAAEIAKDRDPGRPQIELVVETNGTGRRHVSDPKIGAGAVARYNARSWAAFGLLAGALSGITGGGIIGILKGGLLTGIAWGLFGLVAGALYGLWAGRATSARRLRGIGPILAPGTSTLLGWAETPLTQTMTNTLAQPGHPQQLALTFTPDRNGAVLETSADLARDRDP